MEVFESDAGINKAVVKDFVGTSIFILLDLF